MKNIKKITVVVILTVVCVLSIIILTGKCDNSIASKSLNCEKHITR